MTTSNDTTQIPYGYCQCGCGHKTNIAKKTVNKKGYIKGKPQKYLSGHTSRLSTKDMTIRFWSKVTMTADSEKCWEWQGRLEKNGYVKFWWNKRLEQGHRVAWMITYGEIPNRLHVLHKCDNPKCMNPNHLFLGTHQNNMEDKAKKNRAYRPTWFGEESYSNKLKSTDIIEIRKRYSDGNITQKQLAIEYNISQPEISRIIQRKQWKEVL